MSRTNMKKKQQSHPRLRQWLRITLVLIGLGLFAYSAQALALWLPWRWAYQYASNATVWPWWQIGMSLGVIAVAVVLWRFKFPRFATILAVLGAMTLTPMIVLLVTQQVYASAHNVALSPLGQLKMLRTAYPATDPSIRYGSVNGTDLYLTKYADQERLHGTVVYVHGGGWSGGRRTENGELFRWLNGLGYTVYSIDYRVSRHTHASYQDAPRDVACALAYVAAYNRRFDIPERVILIGDSAGGQLALRTAYGVSNGDVTSSCGGTPEVPYAVIGVVPAVDFRQLYNDPKLGPTSRANVVRYLGGTPDTVPGAYDEASIMPHVKAGLPPTLIINAGNDTLVSPESGVKLADALKAAGNTAEQYTLPYAAHSYWINPGGYQNQTARGLIEKFLEKN